MPRETRTRRLTRPAPGSTSGDAGTAPRPLASLLAHSRQATDLLPHLHQHALEAADAFVTALELIQLREREELLRDVRALLDEFSSSLSATLNLSSGLDIFCHGANRLFAADRTSVWIHDRRARHLVLQASSDPEEVVRGLRISNEDSSAPAAAA